MSVDLSRRDDVAVLVLSRPRALNALSFAMLEEIGAALDQVAGWAVRAMIVTGEGEKAFCAGADIKELRGRTLMEQRRGSEMGQRTFAKLDRLPVASLAVINGFAYGGGLELALACTFRIATRNAAMALPEIKLGLIPGYGGTQRLPRLVGQARALEMVLTGRTVKVDEAERIGLVNRVVDGDPLDAGIAFVREFTRYSLPALGFARDAVERALDAPFVEGLKVEADLATLAYRTADAEEGMAAFAEKRKPNFKDA